MAGSRPGRIVIHIGRTIRGRIIRLAAGAAVQQAPDHIGGEAPPGHETVLAGVFPCIGRRLAEFALPDLARAVRFGRAQVVAQIPQLSVAQPLLAQGPQNALRPLPACCPVRIRLRVALVGLPVFARQIVQDGFDLGRVVAPGGEFAAQFQAGVFPPGKIGDGPGLEAQAAACGPSGRRVIAARYGAEAVAGPQAAA